MIYRIYQKPSNDEKIKTVKFFFFCKVYVHFLRIMLNALNENDMFFCGKSYIHTINFRCLKVKTHS